MKNNKIDIQQLADAMSEAEITLFSKSSKKGFKTLVYYPMQPTRQLMVGFQPKDGDWQQKDFASSVNSLLDAIKEYNSISIS